MPPPKQGLYDPQFEHEACGVGFVVNIKGKKSHTIVQQALQVLLNLDHRGACGCEANTGDGAGILMQTPHAFFKETTKSGRLHPAVVRLNTAWAWSFCRTKRRSAPSARRFSRPSSTEEGQRVLGWRTVPTNNASLGATARASEPFMRQVFIGRNAKLTDDLAFERKLYVIRKRAENAIRYSGKVKGGDYFYLPSLSFKTVVYKGMLLTDAGRRVLPGLVASGDGIRAGAGPFAFQHQHVPELEPRASVSLSRAQRRNQHPARQHQLDARRARRCSSPNYSATTSKRSCRSSTPTAATRRCSTTASNCSCMAGRALPHAMMMMIPEPWENHESMSAGETRVLRISFLPDGAVGRPGLHRLHRRRQDRRVLDRNGLRPSRYYVTKDDLVIMASRSRRADDRAGTRSPQGPPAAGPHVSGGHRSRAASWPTRN